MIINKDVIKHIRTIESFLIIELKIDVYNSGHSSRILDVNRCTNLLNTQVLSTYGISVYKKYMYPVYFYLEFTNNFVTYEWFSAHMRKSVDVCKKLVESGKQILSSINQN